MTLSIAYNQDGNMLIPKGYRVLESRELLSPNDLYADEGDLVFTSDWRWWRGRTAEHGIFIRDENAGFNKS